MLDGSEIMRGCRGLRGDNGEGLAIAATGGGGGIVGTTGMPGYTDRHGACIGLGVDDCSPAGE